MLNTTITPTSRVLSIPSARYPKCEPREERRKQGDDLNIIHRYRPYRSRECGIWLHCERGCIREKIGDL